MQNIQNTHNPKSSGTYYWNSQDKKLKHFLIICSPGAKST